ncbi:hypothetical protein C8F01DRAFT_1127590 [Mycena amicta]|nr:hypothetical protein C8F01DRAFT_1127590 [Mycena amicta]
MPVIQAESLAYGAFTLVGCAQRALRHAVMLDDDDHLPSPSTFISSNESEPKHSTIIPTITHTTSESPSDVSANTPPGLGKRPQKPDPWAVLIALEIRSRLGPASPVICANCNKSGSHFPSCKRCGGAWCSRQCRIHSEHRCGKVT